MGICPHPFRLSSLPSVRIICLFISGFSFPASHLLRNLTRVSILSLLYLNPHVLNFEEFTVFIFQIFCYLFSYCIFNNTEVFLGPDISFLVLPCSCLRLKKTFRISQRTFIIFRRLLCFILSLCHPWTFHLSVNFDLSFMIEVSKVCCLLFCYIYS